MVCGAVFLLSLQAPQMLGVGRGETGGKKTGLGRSTQRLRGTRMFPISSEGWGSRRLLYYFSVNSIYILGILFHVRYLWQ